MIDTFKKPKNISLQFGLIVNENKMKYMGCTRKETQLDKLILDNRHIDQVKSFGYLGTIVNGNNTLLTPWCRVLEQLTGLQLVKKLRIKTNKELDELIKHRNMINYVKAQ